MTASSAAHGAMPKEKFSVEGDNFLSKASYMVPDDLENLVIQNMLGIRS